MADDKLQQKLADYVEDAHAMEQNDLKMLASMISTTDEKLSEKSRTRLQRSPADRQ